MSDKPTDALLAAIKGYDQAFSKDKRFSRIRGSLQAVSEEAQKLDPVADSDQGLDARSPSQVGREAPVTAQKGAPEAQARLNVEERRHKADEGQDDPPLKRAAKDARTFFRNARATQSDARSEASADDGGRK